ncbi:MAG: ABC transporter ATP-binding protein [Sulfitobacter litoralis]|jgi:subfamily B ATP-binding cassette protein MsbA|uniref:ABC transporter ATP-binding protein n=3 Tax=root TaxID=1 RepID=A0A1H0LUU5_9RHOB|nr:MULTISPECIES: ABC transporter ATP-binding protein [Sulfitobacter]MBQ0716225.1 ABC transporter ATP-binding protein [Sulfitobacter litoralis]MBQ0766104.1 ABC transporter ATP-binding protein [Sulfitobacter litoralis]MBQ0800635.1 ABC transporter ATP-binding protein [Sulfitobacter litoralis]MCF7725285.1 ATP-binding cassette domain-containing protein [Sulfitobacter sp. M22]SDO71962.1 ATP-binding cassette, subfamily B [Sulfitobacter litoralis]|tara:strand:+ start:2427 stop:4286 length:1860 start_codon:yes stop_codon:yes gene_type:complete
MSDVTYSSRELLTWLWRDYLKKHMWVLIVAIIFMSIEASTMGGLAKLMQPMFDQVFVAGDSGALLWVGLVLVGIFVLRAVSGVVQKVLLTRIKQKSAADMRIDLLDRMMVQDGAFHQEHPPGFLIQRVQSDVNAIGSVWQAVITGAGRDLIGLIVLLGVAISIDPVWALLACIGLPLMVMPAALAQRFVRARSREARDLGATLSTRLDEVFHGIVQIKLNALEKYQAKQYRDLTKTYIRTEVRASFGNSAIPGMIDIISGIGFMAVILYGGNEIIEGDKTIGQFMTFFTAMGFTFNPLRRLGAISGLWQTAAAALERLKELMDEPVHLKSPANPVPVPTTPPHIALEGVSLSYGDAKVLDDLTLHAAAGETTALVGASGAGKSTIFNLLTRLIDPQEGSVTIAGVPLADMDIPDLRGLFSVVTQEALLFDETLRENIVLGRENVTDKELQQALDAAHVSDFLPKLEHGLETRVGPRGSALSGGQRQRVVIARALLRNTPILLLDEATSALDAQSEKVVQQALDRLSQGRTTLVIAHRLSTIRGADKIVVMDRGRVMDEGKHEDLLARGGIYADLYRLQFEDGKTVTDGRNLAAMRRMERGLKPVEPNLLQRIGLRLFGT